MRVAIEKEIEIAASERNLVVIEGPRAEVQHERVVAQHIAITGGKSPQAEIVLLAVTAPEDRIEHADSLDQRATYVHAESDAGGQVRIGGDGSARKRCTHRLRVHAFGPRVVLTELRER